jgi:hypothetical protein
MTCVPSCTAPCNLRYEMTDDGAMVDPNQVVFKTSSLAVLRAKERGGAGGGPDDATVVSGAILILQAAYRMWKAGILCDITIATADKELHAHKVMLDTNTCCFCVECRR